MFNRRIRIIFLPKIIFFLGLINPSDLCDSCNHSFFFSFIFFDFDLKLDLSFLPILLILIDFFRLDKLTLLLERWRGMLLLSKLTVLLVVEVLLNSFAPLSWETFTGFKDVFGRSERDRGRVFFEIKKGTHSKRKLSWASFKMAKNKICLIMFYKAPYISPWPIYS